MEFRGGSLTPLGRFIPVILQNRLVIRNIQNDPRIGGLKLVVYEWVVYYFFIGLMTGVVIYQAETRVYQAALLFCKRGADINVRGGDRGSAFEEASSNGHEAITRLLLARGAEQSDTYS